MAQGLIVSANSPLGIYTTEIRVLCHHVNDTETEVDILGAVCKVTAEGVPLSYFTTGATIDNRFSRLRIRRE